MRRMPSIAATGRGYEVRRCSLLYFANRTRDSLETARVRRRLDVATDGVALAHDSISSDRRRVPCPSAVSNFSNLNEIKVLSGPIVL